MELALIKNAIILAKVVMVKEIQKIIIVFIVPKVINLILRTQGIVLKYVNIIGILILQQINTLALKVQVVQDKCHI